MFAARYFAPRYWANRYWPPIGAKLDLTATPAGAAVLQPAPIPVAEPQDERDLMEIIPLVVWLGRL